MQNLIEEHPKVDTLILGTSGILQLCRRRPQTVRRARKGQRRPEEHRHSRRQKIQKFVGGRIPLGVKKTPTTGGFGFARVWNGGSKRPVANHCRGLKRPQEAGTEFARNHSGSLETKPPPTTCAVAARNLSGPPRRSQKRLEQARRGRNSRETTTQRNSCETTAGAWKRRPRPTACAAAVGNL